jgi:hypothetical protein
MSKGRTLLKHDECEVCGQKLIVEKNNRDHTAKDVFDNDDYQIHGCTNEEESDDDDDYQIVKALAQLVDRKYVEEVKAFYGIEHLNF